MKNNMPAFVVSVLLTYFGLALFGKAISPALAVNETSPLLQTLINLTIAGCAFYLGTTQNSNKKDDIIAGLPPATPADPGTTPKENDK